MSEPVSKKRPGGGEDDEEPRDPKKPCLDTIEDEEPDVIVVVGGVEYHEYSKHLCSWSEYFNAALSIWKEATSKRFEFPHMRPEEWELISSIFNPFSPFKPKTLNFLNYQRVLPLCDELLIQEGLDTCDGVTSCLIALAFLSSADCGLHLVSEEALSTSMRYNLPKAKAACFDIIKKSFDSAGYHRFLTLERIKSITQFMLEYDECYHALWGCFEKLLPCDFPKDKEERKNEIRERMFPMMVRAVLESKSE